jgi:hypothetical protein
VGISFMPATSCRSTRALQGGGGEPLTGIHVLTSNPADNAGPLINVQGAASVSSLRATVGNGNWTTQSDTQVAVLPSPARRRAVGATSRGFFFSPNHPLCYFPTAEKRHES